MSKTETAKIRVGVFPNLTAAERAVSRLLEVGFAMERISVVCPTCSEDELPGPAHVDPAGSRTPEAIAKGGVIGGLLGGLTAVVGIVTTGGVGLVAFGPLLGGAAGGSVAGGLIGAMMTRGVEPAIADFYDQALNKGQILVAVEPSADDSPPSLSEAMRVFRETGARPVKLPPE